MLSEWRQAFQRASRWFENHFVPSQEANSLSSVLHPLFYSRNLFSLPLVPCSFPFLFCTPISAGFLWTYCLKVTIHSSAPCSPLCLPTVFPQSCSLKICSNALWGSIDCSVRLVYSTHVGISGTERREDRWKKSQEGVWNHSSLLLPAVGTTVWVTVATSLKHYLDCSMVWIAKALACTVCVPSFLLLCLSAFSSLITQSH